MLPAAFLNENAAWTHARRMEDALVPVNARRPPPRHSVLSTGTCEALVLEGAAPPAHFPQIPPGHE